MHARRTRTTPTGGACVVCTPCHIQWDVREATVVQARSSVCQRNGGRGGGGEEVHTSVAKCTARQGMGARAPVGSRHTHTCVSMAAPLVRL